MKNKWKKLLAIGCLGLAGTGMLTGCSMSADQQAALDLVTEKTDDIIELLEDNMNYTRNTLSKEEAAEKILLGRNYWALGSFDQLEFATTEIDYNGWFDKVVQTFPKQTILYKKSNNSKFISTIRDNTVEEIRASNFTTNKNYQYTDGNSIAYDTTYNSSDFIITNIDLLTHFNLEIITADDIVDIVRLNKGYRFKIITKTTTSTSSLHIEITLEVLDTGYITSIEAKGRLEIDNNGTKEYNSAIASATYKYDNIDFSIVENKLSELNIQL